MDVLIDGILSEMPPAQTAIAVAIAEATGTRKEDISVHFSGAKPPECEWVVTGHFIEGQKIFLAYWDARDRGVQARTVEALCQKIRRLAPSRSSDDRDDTE